MARTLVVLFCVAVTLQRSSALSSPYGYSYSTPYSKVHFNKIVTPADTTLAPHGVRPDPPYPYQYNGRFFSTVQHNIGRADRYSARRSYPITNSIRQPIRNYNSGYQQVQQKSVYKPYNQKYSVKTPTVINSFDNFNNFDVSTIPVKPPTKSTPVLRTPPIQKPVQSVPTVRKPVPFVQKSVPDVQKPVQAIVEIGDSESSQNEVNSEDPEPLNVLRNLVTVAAKVIKPVPAVQKPVQEPVKKPVQAVLKSAPAIPEAAPVLPKAVPAIPKAVPAVPESVNSVVEIGDSESSQNEINSEDPELAPLNVLRNLITIAAKATKHVVTNLAKQAAENAEEDEDNTVLDFSSGSAQETESTVQELVVTEVDTLDKGFSNFKDATKRAELQGFTKNRKVTIFAPDNKAFKKVADKFDYTSLSIAELRKTVLRHILEGEVELKELQSGPLETIDGEILQVQRDDSGLKIQSDTSEVKVKLGDIETEFGLIHIIDSVLI